MCWLHGDLLAILAAATPKDGHPDKRGAEQQGRPAEVVFEKELIRLRDRCCRSGRLGPSADLDDEALIKKHVTRVDLRSDRLVITLAEMKGAKAKQRARSRRLEVSWRKTSSARRREILLPETPSPQPLRPIRSENHALLIASIAKGRLLLNELITEPLITVEGIAEREGCSVRKVNMTISLAFLAPDLVKAAIEGRLPYGMGVARLCELPPEWSRQYRAIGLTPP